LYVCPPHPPPPTHTQRNSATLAIRASLAACCVP
jgi:hypothetical protein